MEIILEEGETVNIQFADTFREPISVGYRKEGIFVYAPEPDAAGREEIVYGLIFPGQPKNINLDFRRENENEVMK